MQLVDWHSGSGISMVRLPRGSTCCRSYGHAEHGQAERAGDAQNMDNADYTERNGLRLQDALDWRALEAQMPEAEAWRPYET